MSAVWITVVVLVGAVGIAGLVRLAGSLRPQRGIGEMPPTPLENLGRIELGVTTAVGPGFVPLVMFVFVRDDPGEHLETAIDPVIVIRSG